MAVEPLYPVVCAKDASAMNQCGDNSLSPMSLAASLISLPCPLVFQYRDNIGVIQLITEVLTRPPASSSEHVPEGFYMLIILTLFQNWCVLFELYLFWAE